MCRLTSTGVACEELAMINSSLGLAGGWVMCSDHPAGKTAAPGVAQYRKLMHVGSAGPETLVSGLDAG